MCRRPHCQQLSVDYVRGTAARRHVNRLCLGAAVPLVESGTKGYIGQVEFIQKVNRSTLQRAHCHFCMNSTLPRSPVSGVPPFVWCVREWRSKIARRWQLDLHPTPSLANMTSEIKAWRTS